MYIWINLKPVLLVVTFKHIDVTDIQIDYC